MNRKITFIFVLLLVGVNAFAQSENRTFYGRLGESRVAMTLTRTGDTLKGTYSYTRIGKPLNVNGKIGANGAFTLTETTVAGAKTGTFTGTWKDSETIGAGILQGEWKNRAGNKTLDFYLSEQLIYFSSGGARLVPRTFFETNRPKMFSISAEYPELSGVPAAVAAEFNRLARKHAMSLTDEFRKEMLAMTAEDLKWTKQQGIPNTSDISYDVIYAADDVISIRFGNYTYTGGAHGNSASFTLNFDFRTGRELKFADLFKPNSNFLQVLSGFCVKKLQDQLNEGNEDEWITTGAGPTDENYASWNISKNGILVNFDAYQVASYAAGPQEVVVPYSKLDALFAKSFKVFGLN
ncbi:MAG: DUF3298 and DUF4163 domain-containing protein [Acidobacteria bacterium]|nr:DUF3298 and DUF4163 domain-containing protein [Acidobacteriota bacterium]